MNNTIPIFTIGYGNRSIQEIIRLLKRYQIDYLIDVRSKPYSKYNPDFSKAPLEEHMIFSGLKYVFMGDQLGGQPDLPSCYTPDGKIDYQKVREKDFFKQGIQRLRKAWEQRLRVALICSEIKPEMCHRCKLIGVSLTTEGIAVQHIDERGESITQEEALLRLTDGQIPLFDSLFEDLTSRKSYQQDSPTEEEGSNGSL